jgi:hypothetical protein
MTTEDRARKDDQGKADITLLPYIGMVRAAEAFMIGELKYGRYNYCKPGLAASQIAGALFRHAGKWYNGEEFDQEDGQHHLGAVIACAMMLLRKQELGTLIDDRYIPAPNIKEVTTNEKAQRTISDRT